jgi:hypothetical protein
MVKIVFVIIAVLLLIPLLYGLGENLDIISEYTTDKADTGNVTGLTGAMVAVMPLAVIFFAFICLYVMVTGLNIVRD